MPQWARVHLGGMHLAAAAGLGLLSPASRRRNPPGDARLAPSRRHLGSSGAPALAAAAAT